MNGTAYMQIHRIPVHPVRANMALHAHVRKHAHENKTKQNTHIHAVIMQHYFNKSAEPLYQLSTCNSRRIGKGNGWKKNVSSDAKTINHI